MKQVFSVAIETTEGKHRGNANMFTWQWGQVFAQGHMVTAGLITMHINCKTLLTAAYVHRSHYSLGTVSVQRVHESSNQHLATCAVLLQSLFLPHVLVRIFRGLAPLLDHV